MRDCAGHCRTHRGQQSRESALNSLPSRRGGRAPPGHGGRHGRRPSAPHAGTPGDGGPASTHLAPRRADARFPVRQVAARTRPAPPAGRAHRGEELKSWNPGNLAVRDARQVSRFPVSRFPARRLALPATAPARLRLADAVIALSPSELVLPAAAGGPGQPPYRAIKRRPAAAPSSARIRG